MGSGAFDTDVYEAARTFRSSTGTPDFDYSHRVSTGRAPRAAHADLDPKGVLVRESRDSDDHPESLAIAVLFDVTGSMGQVPIALQKKLPQLFGLLLRKGYVEHPQIMFGAIGDATCDTVPLQVGQFESDNRMDDQLRNIFIEHGGGAQTTESYELAAYFMARHTSIDCYEKRGKRGYVFIIGDEQPYGTVKPAEVRKFLGDDTLTEPITDDAIFEELKQKYDVYCIQPGEGSSYVGNAKISSHWRRLLGQNYIQVSDPSAVAETIALTIGLGEGTVDLDTGLADLVDVGSTAGAAVSKALATVGTVSRGAVARSAVPADLGSDTDAVARL